MFVAVPLRKRHDLSGRGDATTTTSKSSTLRPRASFKLAPRLLLLRHRAKCNKPVPLRVDGFFSWRPEVRLLFRKGCALWRAGTVARACSPTRGSMPLMLRHGEGWVFPFGDSLFQGAPRNGVSKGENQGGGAAALPLLFSSHRRPPDARERTASGTPQQGRRVGSSLGAFRIGMRSPATPPRSYCFDDNGNRRSICHNGAVGAARAHVVQHVA